MRRNKIKKKYLNSFVQENTSKLERLERSIFMALKSCGLILLLLTWSVIPVIILTILGIDYQNLSDTSSVIVSFFTDLALILVLIKIYNKTLKEDFKKFFVQDFRSHFKVALQYWGVGLFVMIVSNVFISIVMNGQLAENEETVRNLISTFPWYMTFQLLIYAPITEELIFRKSIRDITDHKWIYVLISGLVFGGLHVLSSLESMIDLLYLIPYCSLGFAFALLYRKTDTIFSSMMVHALHNGLALVFYFIAVIS